MKLPVHIGYKFQVAENTKLVLHAGPYIAYAASGKYKAGAISIDAFNKDIEEALGFKYNRFDFGVGLGVGAEFNKIVVGLGYDLGLSNLINVKNSAAVEDITGISNPSGKNMNAYLTVGYKF